MQRGNMLFQLLLEKEDVIRINCSALFINIFLEQQHFTYNFSCMFMFMFCFQFSYDFILHITCFL